MKDPIEVLRRKEAELKQLQQEIEALRLVGRLLKEANLIAAPQTGGKLIQMSEIHLA
jgi:hypothetical protein